MAGFRRGDEVASAGEVCSFSAGHVLTYEEPSRVLELNPAAALTECMDGMQRTAGRVHGLA